MDFGEILEQWERGSYKIQKKPQCNELCPQNRKTPSVSPPPESGQPEGQSSRKEHTGSSPKRHPVDIWLSRYGVTDKDAVEEKQEQRHISPVKLPIEARIDLHGLSRDEAQQHLADFIDMSCRRGFRKVLIIHGKGNHSENLFSGDRAVLTSLVKECIQRDTRLGAFGHPEGRDGGNGATWVVIRNR